MHRVISNCEELFELAMQLRKHIVHFVTPSGLLLMLNNYVQLCDVDAGLPST